MQVYKAFTIRIYPSRLQSERLVSWDDALRFLWNLALEQRFLHAYGCVPRPRCGVVHCSKREHSRFLSAFDQIKELTELRRELPWLADVPRNVCAQLLVELDRAWRRYSTKLSGVPRWKKKGGPRCGMTEPHHIQWSLDRTTLRFPKLGNVRATVDRAPHGRPKTCSIRRDVDQWFAVLVCEVSIPDPTPRLGPVVAIDRGVVNVTADSDGNVIPSPRFYEQAKHRIARAQHVVARRRNGSKNKEKARARLARIYRQIRRQRAHFIHTISSRYAKSHGVVVIEDLRIGNMTASAAGTVEEPGKNVRQKAGLNRSILDAGWGMLAHQLAYKLDWSGGRLVRRNPAYSSQECHGCHHIDPSNRLTQGTFSCVACGLTEHADVNAAKVLLHRASRSVLPVEDPPSGVLRNRKVTAKPNSGRALHDRATDRDTQLLD